jgi:hypothetical protein
MTSIRSFCIAAAALAIAGCDMTSRTDTGKSLATAASPASSASFKPSELQAALRARLKDPDSAQFREMKISGEKRWACLV